MFRSIYEFSAKSLDGELVNLEKYKGKVLVVVNVDRRCGVVYELALHVVSEDSSGALVQVGDSTSLKEASLSCNLTEESVC